MGSRVAMANMHRKSSGWPLTLLGLVLCSALSATMAATGIPHEGGVVTQPKADHDLDAFGLWRQSDDSMQQSDKGAKLHHNNESPVDQIDVKSGVLIGQGNSSSALASENVLISVHGAALWEKLETQKSSQSAEQGMTTRDLINSNCPHPRFTMKHHCSTCSNEEDALEFSRQMRVGRDRTNVNTVICGSPTFHVEGDRCFSNSIKVMTCTLSNGHCTLDGVGCVTQHSTGNGHLFYRDTVC
jgi:hypothetical protein